MLIILNSELKIEYLEDCHGVKFKGKSGDDVRFVGKKAMHALCVACDKYREYHKEEP